jgi:hypothetical protein
MQIMQKADSLGRPTTYDERVVIDELLADAEASREAEKSIRDMGIQLGGGWSSAAGDGRYEGDYGYGSSPGEVFTNSSGWKSLFGAGRERPQQWSTGVIPITSGPPYLSLKGTLGESASTAIGPAIGGGAFVATPQVIPGVVSILTRPLSVEQAFGAGLATGANVRYITEGTATSGAAGVAEGAAKPESQLGFTYADEPIKKIATFLPVSEEMLEDAPAVQPFVNSQLHLRSCLQLRFAGELRRQPPILPSSPSAELRRPPHRL